MLRLKNKFMLTVLAGDCRSTLNQVPSGSVQCCVTSPPYWGLRDYGVEGQIGLEKTPREFVEQLLIVFSEVKRALREDGTIWLNLGDSYAGSWGAQSRGNTTGEGKTTLGGTSMLAARQIKAAPILQSGTGSTKRTPGIKGKDLVGIPWMVAFALRDELGLYLRQDIIWSKPSCMPESVIDRCTKSHEYIFLLTKSPDYYYDAEAVKEKCSDSFMNDSRWKTGATDTNVKDGYDESGAQNPKSVHRMFNKRESVKRGEFNGKANELKGREAFRAVRETRNKRSVWMEDENLELLQWLANQDGGPELIQRFISENSNLKSVWRIATANYKEAHFATFPPKLITPCILAGSKAGDTVLDPFGGSFTTAQVAMEHGRRAIMCELNPNYVELGNSRCELTPGLGL